MPVCMLCYNKVKQLGMCETKIDKKSTDPVKCNSRALGSSFIKADGNIHFFYLGSLFSD